MEIAIECFLFSAAEILGTFAFLSSHVARKPIFLETQQLFGGMYKTFPHSLEQKKKSKENWIKPEQTKKWTVRMRNEEKQQYESV